MIDRAVEILRRGGLVAFPTETVYGLGADARNPDAVAKIFAAKGRPATNPLIVHAWTKSVAKQYASAWPTIADRLADAFWPGPLTLILPKAKSIVDAVSAGTQTVGLRVPDNSIALKLLLGFNGPVAAPSANRSNRISPTSAEHVREELGDKVDLILDGGDTYFGIESTVLNLTSSMPTILRPGSISAAQIEEVIGRVELRSESLDASTVATSPGQQSTHYAPRTPMYWMHAGETPPPTDGKTVQLIICNAGISSADAEICMPFTARDYAHDLYRSLREADAMAMDRILIEIPPDVPEWTAVRDRVLRAAKPWRQMS